ncbi:hypothetical protein [Rhizobium leucaenae]|uniref:hypothetical protein n=1 Tax=Rhizobium leucaenae TaxID=29450 RepID=UPI0007EE6324|nr:hypothetical protein [Rhizobium leucaenae]
MDFSVATVTLRSFSPYSQSKQHDEPSLKGEGKGDYDKRTWKAKAHITKDGTLGIPAASMTQAIAEAAKYSKKQIPGQGKATWTAKFKSGIMLVDSFIDTGIILKDADFVDIMCDAQGKTGSAVSSRVPRRFPQVPEWSATFQVWILDPIITEEIFREMVELAGMFIGIGRWRPVMNGGMNGRFIIDKLKWEDNRKFAA